MFYIIVNAELDSDYFSTKTAYGSQLPMNTEQRIKGGCMCMNEELNQHKVVQLLPIT
jgi:hypothetical protein